MKIVAENLGKRFNREWIFRNFNFTLEQNNVYAVIGSNGSGKSTLSQILWGQVPPSSGSIKYYNGENSILSTDVYQFVSIATPYMDLIDEFTLAETIEFHFKFKKPVEGLTASEIINRMELGHARDKKIAAFSSGMRQRVKLGLAFFSATPILFLDEPTTNLDRSATSWYQENLGLQKDRLIVIASNQEAEYPANSVKIDLSAWKPGLLKQTRLD